MLETVSAHTGLYVFTLINDLIAYLSCDYRHSNDKYRHNIVSHLVFEVE